MREFDTYTKDDQAMFVIPDEVFPGTESDAWAFLVELAADGGWLENSYDIDPTPLWRDRILLRFKHGGSTYYRLDPRLRQLVLHIEETDPDQPATDG